VHHELVVPDIHQFDEKLTQSRGGVDVDLPLHIDDFDSILGVVIQLQIHVSSRASLSPSWVPAQRPGGTSSPRIQPRSDVMSTRVPVKSLTGPQRTEGGPWRAPTPPAAGGPPTLPRPRGRGKAAPDGPARARAKPTARTAVPAGAAGPDG